MFVKIESAEDGISKISLSNPNMNVLSNQVKKEIKDAFTQVSQDQKVRVVIFETEGSHFCCGADLKEFPERIANKTATKVWDEGHDMLQAILYTPQPTIARIQGNALGGGAELALAFDLRIFANNAKFGLPEVSRGVFPGNGGLERLVDIVGLGNAMNLIVTGSMIGADEAKGMGIATQVVSPEELTSSGDELAKHLAALPSIAVKAAKRAVNEYHAAKKDFNRIGRELFHHVHETEDVREGVQAFFEKRKPVFKHH
jgi:enoyl-CoA hydratase/carnithine racemase